jgi:hypothetical protein
MGDLEVLTGGLRARARWLGPLVAGFEKAIARLARAWWVDLLRVAGERMGLD